MYILSRFSLILKKYVEKFKYALKMFSAIQPNFYINFFIYLWKTDSNRKEIYKTLPILSESTILES